MRIALSLVLLAAVLSACPSVSPTNHDAGAGGGGASDAGAGGGTGGDGGTDDAGIPLRILVMFDGAPSLTVTDPNATRVEALRALLVAHANEPNTSVAVMVFSGGTTAWFSSSTGEFVPMTSLTSSDRNTMLARVASFAAPADGGTGTDFVQPLSDAYASLSADISAQQGSTYAVIFLSDGRPSTDQDTALLCGDIVYRLRDLRLTGAADVRVNTVHVFTPLAAPTCTGDAGWIVSGQPCTVPVVGNPGECPAAEADADAFRLREMSVIGGGQFRDVRDHDAVDFTGLVP